ncbi:uncharacterized protein FIBRA_00196 [Fibroporia radiculosa]|uniref:Uncharacterized protein n=1 Tax=Fibroporia radiculosa TaxID=599839 RepID=J7RGK9_9APHY|nr:uncharacterized protein FIBRA_00196 [Fibroporia radiculosa]CCL98202.1 predicted protein [Fibroporia radiculosa]
MRASTVLIALAAVAMQVVVPVMSYPSSSYALYRRDGFDALSARDYQLYDLLARADRQYAAQNLYNRQASAGTPRSRRRQIQNHISQQGTEAVATDAALDHAAGSVVKDWWSKHAGSIVDGIKTTIEGTVESAGGVVLANEISSAGAPAATAA